MAACLGLFSGTADSDVKCEQCPDGTFSDTVSYTDPCRPHTKWLKDSRIYIQLFWELRSLTSLSLSLSLQLSWKGCCRTRQRYRRHRVSTWGYYSHNRVSNQTKRASRWDWVHKRKCNDDHRLQRSTWTHRLHTVFQPICFRGSLQPLNKKPTTKHSIWQ